MGKLDQKSKFAEYLLLLLLIFLGAILRFYRLGDWSLWNDESHTIETALMGISKGAVGPVFYPINFILTQISFNILGVSEFSARFFPCIFGILTIPATYFLAKELFNSKIGLIAALFIALYTWHIDWSQNARYYTLESFLIVISSIMFYKGLERNRWQLIMISPFIFLLAMLSHPSALFMVAACIVYLFILLAIHIEKPVNYKRNLLLFVTLFLIGFLSLSSWYITLPTVLIKEKGVVTTPSYILMNLAYHVQLPFLILALSAGIHLILCRDRKGIYLLCCLIIPLLMLIAASIKTLAYGVYVFYTLPFYCILVAYACAQLFKYTITELRVLTYGIVFGLIALLISSNYLYFNYENGNRPRWKEASLYIKNNIKAGDVVFASDGSTANFYLGNQLAVFWINRFESVFRENSNRRIWFLIYNENSNTLRGSIINFIRSQCKYMAEFTVNTSVKIRDINVYQCVPERTSLAGGFL